MNVFPTDLLQNASIRYEPGYGALTHTERVPGNRQRDGPEMNSVGYDVAPRQLRDTREGLVHMGA